MKWIEIAPAKINLSLHVTGRRPNGYHELSSLVVFSNFGDEITLEKSSSFQLNSSGPFASYLPKMHDNIMVRAAEGAASLFQKDLFIKIHLTKNLPISSGIGGGTSDAATLLRLLLRYWDIQQLPDHWNDFLLSLGADMPVCFLQKPCLMSGIGEVLEPFDLPFSLSMLLINPLKSISTPESFKRRIGSFSRPCMIPDTSNEAHFIEDLNNFQNDLTLPATFLCPEVREILFQFEQDPQCLLSRMSGSGATCFGIYETKKIAQEAYERFKQKFPTFWVRFIETKSSLKMP
jgi:4-diphosphocytidyl-2-C-methyl-D-erythritol kinase